VPPLVRKYPSLGYQSAEKLTGKQSCGARSPSSMRYPLRSYLSLLCDGMRGFRETVVSNNVPKPGRRSIHDIRKGLSEMLPEAGAGRKLRSGNTGRDETGPKLTCTLRIVPSLPP
jgi:hypothetical protein